MRIDLLNEVIQLKEERRILEAACGMSTVERHCFTRDEKAQMKVLRTSNRSEELLRDVERRIFLDELELLREGRERRIESSRH